MEMDRFTLAILAVLIGLAAFLMFCIFRMDPPKALVPLGPERKPEPSLWSSPAFRRDVGRFFLYVVQWAVYGAIAIRIIAAGVRLGLAH